jgi:fructosamine-3-kinase
MTIPSHIVRDVSAALGDWGLGTRIVRAAPVGGGCINHGTRLETDAGEVLFLKWNASAPAGMFEMEVDGLRALRGIAGVRVPAPLAFGPTWLLLEHVEPGRERPETSEALGHMVAGLHAGATATSFGWPNDNWIGSLPQTNTRLQSWGDFWRDHRIAPQLERARRQGRLQDAPFDDVLAVIPEALADIERPVLVHGDLWGGNWLTGASGEPWLIDPAVYLGHGEVDLAMSELFSGFDRPFYDAYDETHGRSSAYAAYRRDLYQLYYLLVHVNLFGASYESGARRAAERVVAALR